ncbi:ribonuclease P/MRP protein subunit POP5 [Lampris incognitus]|uniref:ribonuclease P/MRP protein subunit POP5 n=1 Tax=Lampris incognitus TaxID=2546036 RepID=UPI0024B5DDCD|nr:ribonuclease P/MRP protein subunit POP5 [Lampris incognitus]
MVRAKSRYLLCEVNVSDPNSLMQLSDWCVTKAVMDVVRMAHGDYGSALCSSGFSVKYLNAHTGIVFLRCPKNYYRLIWSALPFITSIDTGQKRVPCFLNCLHVGGTIRTCQKFLVQYNTRQLHRMLPKCKSEGEKLHVRQAILSCSLRLMKGNKEVSESESEEEDQ